MGRSFLLLVAGVFGVVLVTALAPLQAAVVPVAASERTDTSFARMRVAAEMQAVRGAFEHGCKCPEAAAHARPAVSHESKDYSSGEPQAVESLMRPRLAIASSPLAGASLQNEIPPGSRPLYLLGSRLRR